MILLIDNYDSFTYNLYQRFLMLEASVRVVRNDEIDLEEIDALDPEMIVISPGPGRPENAGISLAIVDRFSGRIPILGICLGMQVIAQAFGGRIIHAKQPVHGKVRPISHKGSAMFDGLSNPLNVTRYHSLVVDRESLPDCFTIDAVSESGEIMALAHQTLALWGVQFHPEALLTDCGFELLANAVTFSRKRNRATV